MTTKPDVDAVAYCADCPPAVTTPSRRARDLSVTTVQYLGRGIESARDMFSHIVNRSIVQRSQTVEAIHAFECTAFIVCGRV